MLVTQEMPSTFDSHVIGHDHFGHGGHADHVGADGCAE